MKLLDIAGLKDRNPFDLSSGQMQRNGNSQYSCYAAGDHDTWMKTDFTA